MAEATLVLPLLLVLLFAICEFGRAFYTYNTLNKTMQNGARHLSANALFGDTSTIQFNYTGPDGNAFQAINLIVYGDVDGGSVPVLAGLSASDIDITQPTPSLIRISVSYNYIPMIGSVFRPFGIGPSIDLGFTLNAVISMRAL